MTPEIEKRIKTVQAGRVPAGYKRTPIGVIPKEWNMTSLKDVANHVIEKNKNNAVHLTLTNSATKGVIKQEDYFDKQISNNENTDGYYLVKDGDFIYNPRISESAPCGPINRSHIGEIGIASPLYTVFRLKENVQNVDYIELYLKSPFWHRYMSGVANYGARHDRMNITNDDLFAMPLPIPPLSEQKKIAEILATQDRVIELKEKLIAEKQSQKKYLMSVLLGDDFKKPFKLNGVTIDKKKWRDVSLSDCCLSEGQYGLNAPACAFKDNLPKYIRITDIDEDGRYNRSSVAYVDVDDYENYLLNENDVLLVRTGSTTGKSYLYDKNDGKLVYAGFLIRFNINPEFVDKRVVYACLNTNSYWKWVGVMSMRSGQPGINATEYSKYRFKIPLDKKEQKAIADVLSAVDEEISLLQKDLEQEKLKKKSLMQLLLTGLVRVQ